MKSFIVFALLVAAAVAGPLSPDGVAEIVSYESDNIGVDGYNYGYKTSNGIQAEETGALKNLGTDGEALQVRGSYSYIGDDGITYSITYIADENGFQPSGAHLPTNP